MLNEGIPSVSRLVQASAQSLPSTPRATRGASVVMPCEAAPEAVTITIDDNGPGLPESMLERVFEPFFRLEASRSPETGGSGLGLAIARAIIRGHGGDIVLENRPPVGRPPVDRPPVDQRAGGLRATVQLPGPATGRSGDT